ncbi:MAG: RNA polymerase sigma factor [Chitinophagaceae bacterium]
MAKEYKCQKVVYENYLGFALKIVFRYIYRYDRAVDVVNDSFVKLFSNFDRFTAVADDTGNRRLLMGYIKRIMINSSIDELRKGNMMQETGPVPDYVWDFSVKDHDADQQLLYKQLILMIKELPPSYRTVFNLYVIDGYSHAEIAEIMQIPVGSSKSNLARAKKMLQLSIKKLEDQSYAVIR